MNKLLKPKAAPIFQQPEALATAGRSHTEEFSAETNSPLLQYIGLILRRDGWDTFEIKQEQLILTKNTKKNINKTWKIKTFVQYLRQLQNDKNR